MVTAETTIISYSEVQFGKNCLLAWDTLVMDTDFHKIKNEFGQVINSPRPIIVGDNVWIGCRCLVLSPVKCVKEPISWER
jgi:acetyltransferase-like isoleucine patch superfamily enzyme